MIVLRVLSRETSDCQYRLSSSMIRKSIIVSIGKSFAITMQIHTFNVTTTLSSDIPSSYSSTIGCNLWRTYPIPNKLRWLISWFCPMQHRRYRSGWSPKTKWRPAPRTPRRDEVLWIGEITNDTRPRNGVGRMVIRSYGAVQQGYNFSEICRARPVGVGAYCTQSQSS